MENTPFFLNSRDNLLRTVTKTLKKKYIANKKLKKKYSCQNKY